MSTLEVLVQHCSLIPGIINISKESGPQVPVIRLPERTLLDCEGDANLATAASRALPPRDVLPCARQGPSIFCLPAKVVCWLARCLRKAPTSSPRGQAASASTWRCGSPGLAPGDWCSLAGS